MRRIKVDLYASLSTDQGLHKRLMQRVSAPMKLSLLMIPCTIVAGSSLDMMDRSMPSQSSRHGYGAPRVTSQNDEHGKTKSENLRTGFATTVVFVAFAIC